VTAIVELATTYEAFWTGMSWQAEPPWQQVRNEWGFIDRSTGNLLPAFPDIPPSPAPFPFIVYPVVQPQFKQGMIANARVFDRRPAMPNFRGLTNDVLHQMQGFIPPNDEGLILFVDDIGLIRLKYQNMGYVPQEDRAEVQAVFNFTVESYITGVRW